MQSVLECVERLNPNRVYIVQCRYNDFLGIAYEAGARIHTNSWGTDVNAYTTTSRDMDRYSYDHQDFLVLVAGGNSGDAGFYTIGSPATAKNVLAVGASMSNALGFSDDTTGPYCGSVASCTNYFVDLADNLASFSSLGPTFDGRMKPDVVSVGFYISSAYSSANPNSLTCAVEAKAGTSMATPVTAGAAALIREYFENDGIVPMGALIKAALIHSASPLSDPDWERGMGNDNVQLDGEVDTNQGYGLIGLHRVLSFDDSPFQLKCVYESLSLHALVVVFACGMIHRLTVGSLQILRCLQWELRGGRLR